MHPADDEPCRRCNVPTMQRRSAMPTISHADDQPCRRSAMPTILYADDQPCRRSDMHLPRADNTYFTQHCPIILNRAAVTMSFQQSLSNHVRHSSRLQLLSCYPNKPKSTFRRQESDRPWSIVQINTRHDCAVCGIMALAKNW
jgi:hypothetical protein